MAITSVVDASTTLVYQATSADTSPPDPPQPDCRRRGKGDSSPRRPGQNRKHGGVGVYRVAWARSIALNSGGILVTTAYHHVLSVRPGLWAGVCRLGCRIPSRGLHAPLVLPVGSASRAEASAGRRRWQRRPLGMRAHPRLSGPDGRPIARNPQRPAGAPPGGVATSLDPRLWHGGGNPPVTLRGVKQPSRLTCSATGPEGASCPAGAPCQGPQPVTGCAHVVRMWALPSGGPGALACRRRLRRAPREGRCIVNKRLPIGGTC